MDYRQKKEQAGARVGETKQTIWVGIRKMTSRGHSEQSVVKYTGIEQMANGHRADGKKVSL